MNSTVVELRQSVIERLRTAIDFLVREYPGTQISVSRVCQVAKVNRGNVYVSHPEIIQEILAHRKSARCQNSGSPKRELQRELSKRVSTLNLEKKALLYALLEQKLKIRELEQIISDKDRALSRKQKER
ncbi:hypothetical protein PXJ20_03875 [Paraburkholderia sp. A1RI_3L]|uniref:hypothetical protein n=1 Tax=Paraburkholderia TaxID=1822464 RepID=UPI0018F46FD8|nr:hypothetical protein [Paraburkholderia kururiensis]